MYTTPSKIYPEILLCRLYSNKKTTLENYYLNIFLNFGINNYHMNFSKIVLNILCCSYIFYSKVKASLFKRPLALRPSNQDLDGGTCTTRQRISLRSIPTSYVSRRKAVMDRTSNNGSSRSWFWLAFQPVFRSCAQALGSNYPVAQPLLWNWQ